jgi:hypothetical protein
MVSSSRPDLGYYSFRLDEDLFVCCIILSYIKSIVVFGTGLGSYHEYGTYQAISHSSTEISLELSELTGWRLKQIWLI